MKHLIKLNTDEEKKSFVNNGGLNRPTIISYGNKTDVNYYPSRLVKFKHVIPEDAEIISSYVDGNTYKLCSDGYIYDSLKINGVEMAKPLGEIKNSGIMPVHIEEERTTTLTMDNPLPLFYKEEITCFFENDFDVENGYIYVVMNTNGQYQILYGQLSSDSLPVAAMIKSINSKQIVFNSHPLLRIMFESQGMIFEELTEEELEILTSNLIASLEAIDYSLSVYFSNSLIENIPLDNNKLGYGQINELFEGKTIPVSGTYTFAGDVYPDIFTDDINYSHDLTIKLTEPITEDVTVMIGYLFLTFEEFKSMGAIISEDLMSIQLGFGLIDYLANCVNSKKNIIFIHKTNGRIFYEIEYRNGGVPANIYTNLDPATYDIVATIDPIYYKENEEGAGYTAFPVIPLSLYILNTSGGSIREYVYPYCTEITLPGDILEIPSDFADGNKYLTSVTLGESVAGIGYYAFNWCTSLKTITCHAVICPTLRKPTSNHISMAFYGMPENGVLRVPKGSDYTSWLNALPSGWVIEYI